MDDFVKICSVEDIPDNEPLAIEVDGMPIAICRVGDKLYAIEDVCPHQGASYEGGEVDGEVLTCPLHGWRTNIVTGRSLEAPAIEIETYEVRVENGFVYIKIEE